VNDPSAAAPGVRASDADREHVADRLRENTGDGRLTPDELAERLDVVYAARTIGELDAVLHDLPGDAPVPELVRRRAIARQALMHRAGGALITDALVVGIWAATGADSSFWPFWVILFTTIALARDAWRRLGPGGTLSDSELGEYRRERHARRRERRELRRGP
jgi:hypothetical protein